MECFQVIDPKNKCDRIYFEGQLTSFDSLSSTDLCGTWGYSSNLDLLNVEYAQLYCLGKTLNEVCPSHLEDRWEAASKKMKAFVRCFGNAKISLEEHCFYDMVPTHFLMDFFKVKTQITKSVLKSHKRPDNYDFLLRLMKLVRTIEDTPIKFNFKNVDSIVLSRNSNKNLIKKINTSKGCIKYNMDGTRTGRLTTKSGSFPILTLKKEFRNGIEPQNDLFIEMDYNAAELRTLLALLGKEQPEEDIHEWNAKNIYRGLHPRKEAKERIFAWLYNPHSKDHLSNRAYDKEVLKQKYWDGKIVTTPYNREIEADEFHALNYLIQSTTSDLFLRRVVAINELLKGRKSKITFMIHDSVVIDYSSEDKDLFKQMVDVFSKTDLGTFKVNTSIGKNFGEMKQL